MNKPSSELLSFLYRSHTGRLLRFVALRRRLVSKLSGTYCDSRFSRRHILPFIKAHNIDMQEALEPVAGFSTFNEFFYRKLKPSARPIDQMQGSVVSPSDGTVCSLQLVNSRTQFALKGCNITLDELLKDEPLAQEFAGGDLLLFRLAPWDYHRYHFPINCVPSVSRVIHGAFESVHPIAYQAGVPSLLLNERRVIMLKTDEGYSICMVVVGAMCVGRIVNTYSPGKNYQKGDEAGYFAFGGSSIVLLFPKGTAKIAPRILKASQQGQECRITMGGQVARIKK